MDSRRHAIEGEKTLEASSGTVLGGRYRVKGVLGSGGMAVVYRAEDSILGRTVALKTLHRRYAEMPSFRRRFRQEARAMASLDHENIVKVFDISHDGEVPFIVAECVTGKDVGGLLAESRGRLDEALARKLVVQLLEALAYAHRRGIIHRDIKPSNILTTPGGTVKVADFGIAKIVEDDEIGEPGEVIGSARYMAPEQLKGREATQQSDIYSVGILLYHCLTGRPPFSGDLNSLAKQQIHDTPKPLRKINKRISPNMESVVMKALEKEPENRYPSATAMLDDLAENGAYGRSLIATHEVQKAQKRTRRSYGRVALVSTLLGLLLIGAGTTVGATSMGYVDLNQNDGEQAASVTPANPVQTARIEAPETSVAEETTAEPARELVAVPEVRPYYDYSAEEILLNRGFQVQVVYDYQPGYADRGVAWGTDPAVGTLAPEGSVVTVFATPKDYYQPQIETQNASAQTPVQ